jgi:ABC-type phosphate/phosphonate transport system substrate-binding protein
MLTRRSFLTLGLGTAFGLREAAAAAGRSWRIGVVATLSPGTPAALLSLAMRPLRSYMDEQAGAAGEVVRGGDAFDLARSLRDGGVDVAIFHGHEFAWARAKHPTLEPVVVCVNLVRSVRAYLVAATTFGGYLQGQTIALPRDSREHCRLYFERRCAPPGTDANAFYRRVSRPAEAADALDEVATNKAQVALVDAVGWDRYQRSSPARAARLKVIYHSEEFPPGVLAYDPARFAAADALRLRDALVRAKDHPKGRASLQALRLAAFEPPGEGLAASLEAIAKAYPPR